MAKNLSRTLTTIKSISFLSKQKIIQFSNNALAIPIRVFKLLFWKCGRTAGESYNIDGVLYVYIQHVELWNCENASDTVCLLWDNQCSIWTCVVCAFVNSLKNLDNCFLPISGRTTILTQFTQMTHRMVVRMMLYQSQCKVMLIIVRYIQKSKRNPVVSILKIGEPL